MEWRRPERGERMAARLPLVLLLCALLGAAAAAGGERSGVSCRLGWDQRGGQSGTPGGLGRPQPRAGARRGARPGRCLTWLGFGEPGADGAGFRGAERVGKLVRVGGVAAGTRGERKRFTGGQPGAARSPLRAVGRVGLGFSRLVENRAIIWLGRDRKTPI